MYMYIASKYCFTLIETLQQLNNQKCKLRQLLSEHDKRLSDLYHEVETGKFNAAAGYIKLKEIQSVLRKRRVIKHELALLQKLTDSINAEKVLKDLLKVKNIIDKQANRNLEYCADWEINIEEIIS